MPNNLLNIYSISAELLMEGEERSLGSIEVHFRSPTDRGHKEVSEALADVAEGRAKVCVNVTMYRIIPVVMTDNHFSPLPGIADHGLKWIHVRDYVICLVYFGQGQAPSGENEYVAAAHELLKTLIAKSFPGVELRVITKDRGHYHPDIYVSRAGQL